MKQKVEQRTFYGEGCEGKALEWLCNMEKCFSLIKINWRKYKVKADWLGYKQSRCQVILKYK